MLIVLGILASSGLFSFERSQAESPFSANSDNGVSGSIGTWTPLSRLEDSGDAPATALPLEQSTLEQGGLVFILRLQLPDDKRGTEAHIALLNSSFEVIKHRLSQIGAPAPLCKALEGDLFLLEFPGPDDTSAIESALEPTRNILAFHIVYPQEKLGGNSELPDDALELPLQGRPDETLVVYKEPAMEAGRHIIDAKPDSSANYSSVLVELDADGAALFEKITAANISRAMAIVVDGSVISAPIIHDKIAGGKIAISGNFSYAELSELAITLRASSLAQPFTILEKRVIAPAVGKGVGS